jgi:hypothetical protein
MTVGDFIGYQGTFPGKRISTAFTSAISDFDDWAKNDFARVLRIWSEKVFRPQLKNSIKNSMWVRSGQLLNGVGVRITEPVGSGLTTRFRAYATFPNDEERKKAFSLEMGRAKGGAIKGKAYMVPLASWLNAAGRASAGGADGGRPWVDSAKIKEDLSQPGVFWKRISPGVRLVMRYKPEFLRDQKTKRYRNPVTGRFQKRPKIKRTDSLGRKKTRGTLRQVAIGMYLALDSATGVFGTSRRFAKRARQPKSPLAARFGLSETSVNAPVWFTRGAVNSLGALASAVSRVKITTTDVMKKTVTGAVTRTEEDVSEFEDALSKDLRELGRSIFDVVAENLELGDESTWYHGWEGKGED